MRLDENKLIRDLDGTRQTVKNCALKCNRCGACAQMCPSYRANLAEVYSPRALSQLARKLGENKINFDKNKKYVAQTAAACINCKTCLLACPAKVPVPALAKELCLLCGVSPLPVFKKLCYVLGVKFPRAYFFIKSLFVKLPKVEKPKAFFAPSSAALHTLPEATRVLKCGPAGFLKTGLLLGAASLNKEQDLLLKIYDNLLEEYSAAAPLPIIADGLDTYFALKEAALWDEKYKIISDNAKYISEFKLNGKPRKDLWENKKILMQIPAAAQGYSLTDSIKNLFNCKGSKFMVEFNSENPLSCGYLAYGGKNRAKKQIGLVFAQGVKEAKADILIVFNAEEEKYLNKIFSRRAKETKALFITRALGAMYD